MSRALGRYVALQLPQLGLVAWAAFWLAGRLDWPAWVAWALLGAWVAKEVAIYPLVRRSLSDLPGRGGVDELRGATALVRESVAPEGWVEVGGELWRARGPEGGEPLPAGSAVRVREVRELTLLVEPVAPAAQATGAAGRNEAR